MPKIDDATRERRRDRLVEPAWSCAARMGYRNWTVEDVCAEAGVSKGAFYGYFASKEALLLELVERDAARSEAVIDDLLRSDIPGRERLIGCVHAMLRTGEELGRVQVRADLWAEVHANDDLRASVQALVRRRRRILEALIGASVSPDVLADAPARAFAAFLIALVDGLSLHSAIDPGAFRWSNIQRALDVTLAGVASG